jgi:hypothetical protein
LFGNNELPFNERSKRLNEIDAGIDSEVDVWQFTASPSAWMYAYPGLPDDPASAEIGARGAYGWEAVEFFTSHWGDTASQAGAYLGNLGILAGSERGASASEFSVAAGWGSAKFNDRYADTNAAALDHVTADIRVGFSLGRGLYLCPHASVSFIADEHVADAGGQNNIGDLGVAFGGEL